MSDESTTKADASAADVELRPRYDPDVASPFKTSESFNDAPREAMKSFLASSEARVRGTGGA